MTTQNHGRILESEYQALETIHSHVAHVVFSQLKRKYRGPGTEPDYLNKIELDRFGVSKDSYARSIKKLIEAGLLTVSRKKIINGFSCRLFGFPHENGVIKESQQYDSRTVESNSTMVRLDSTIVGPLNAQQYDGASRQYDGASQQYDSRTPLRSEDKKIKKEDKKRDFDNLVSDVGSIKDSGFRTINDPSTQDPVPAVGTIKDPSTKPLVQPLDTIKNSDDKIYIRIPLEHSNKKDNDVSYSKINPWSPAEKKLVMDSIGFLKQLKIGNLNRTEAASLLSQLQSNLSSMSSVPDLSQHKKMLAKETLQWMADNPLSQLQVPAEETIKEPLTQPQVQPLETIKELSTQHPELFDSGESEIDAKTMERFLAEDARWEKELLRKTKNPIPVRADKFKYSYAEEQF